MLVALAEPAERWSVRLAWSTFRRHHQAIARRAHTRRRSRAHDQAFSGADPTQRPVVHVLVGGPLELSEEHWGRIQPLLPPQKPKTGRPGHDQRTLLAGILWVIRRGASWRELPADYGPWKTLYACYQRWRKAGIWQQILDVLQLAEKAI